MDRSNYNRGGGNDGGNRGGRGRGNSVNRGGYHHHGGRSRNYPTQCGNQHQEHDQEHHGGGRGKGRGTISGGLGRGRCQPTNPTPAYARQNADRVPDRFDGGREGNRWSREVSGQPIRSPSVARTQTQNRPDLPALEGRFSSSVSVTEHSNDDEANAYVPIRRTDRGTLAYKSVKLLVNHFPVKFDPSNTILRYDMEVKQVYEHDASSSTRPLKKSIPKSSLRQIQEKLCAEYPDQFPLLQTAYDGEKNIFSAISLQPGTYTVGLSGRSYSCTIKEGNALNLSKLQDFLIGNAMQIPREVLHALDVVMKANLFREKVSVGRAMYPRVHRNEDDLRCGVAAYRGSQQSLKVTSNGLIMCTDYAVMPFRKRMPVLDFLKEHVREIQGVDDIPRNRKKVMCALKGLRVSVTHRRTNQKYTIFELTDKLTKEISFELEDPEGKQEVVMLTDYFRDRWHKEIMHKGIPCLQLGNGKRPNYVPMEFCILAEDRRFPKEQLGKEAARTLKDLSLLPPDNRRREICSMVCEEYATGHLGAEVIQNFEVEVGMNMSEVVGRVIEPPKLKLGGSHGQTSIVTVDKQKCQYNLLGGKALVAGVSVERWALLDFCSGHRYHPLKVNSFIPNLMKRCKSIGINMEEPLRVDQITMNELSDVNSVRNLFKWLVEECRKIDTGRLQVIVCVMPEIHHGYKYIKLVSEVEIGVMTQCCLSQNANKSNDQFLANLGMKINAKLGGVNMELVERFPLFSRDDHLMFIGADVNHPAALNTSSPSIAAVVGSVNPTATRYVARVSPQNHRKEEIVNFGILCLDLINTYAKVNGVKPNKIVVFRDGVSDDQFEMVLNKEMVGLKKAIYSVDYRPLVTFVVAQKRHTTRLFLNDKGDIGNVPPGTVVDTNIVHPTNADFYLCSHFGVIGTSKPTHYTMIWNEIGFSSDEMQKLIYNMCFIFARCTKPVSLVPPVYYADLVAYRGRMFEEVVIEMEDSGFRAVSSFDQYFYNLDQHLKDSMFFI